MDPYTAAELLAKFVYMLESTNYHHFNISHNKRSEYDLQKTFRKDCFVKKWLVCMNWQP